MINSRSLFLIFLALVLMCGSASAYARYQNTTGEGQIRVLGETGGITLAEIDAALDAQDDVTYGGPYPNVITYNNTTNSYYINYGYINSVSGSVINLSGNVILFNNTELPTNSDLVGDYFNLTNSKLYAVYPNATYVTNTDDMNNLAISRSVFQNTEFHYFDTVRNYYLEDNIDNITMSGCKYGLDVRYAYNKTITNITASDSEVWQIYVVSSDNVTVDTVHSTNAGDYLNPSSDANVVSFDGAVTNSTIRNVWADGSGWSGIDVSGDIGDSSNIIVENIYMNNSGHNGIDVHQGFYVTVKDCVVTNSVADNYLIGGNPDTYTTQNITVENCTSVNAGGNGFFISGVDNFSADGFTTAGDNTAVKILAGTNGILKNITTDNYIVLAADTTYSIPSDKITIINSDIGGNTWLYDATNINLTNCNNTFEFKTGTHNGTVLYPLNIQVLNTTGYAVSDALITITGTTFSLNGLGETVTTAHTDSRGRLNESQLLYVADFLRDSSAGYTYYTVDVQASKDGQTDSELAINPDSSWYSSDLDNLNGTLYTLTLDVTGNGTIPLTISSFTPTDTTPSSVNGTEQTFTATFSIESNASWYVDSVLQEWDNSTTLASYSNSTASVGEHNVTVIGYSGVESISQEWTWTVTETPMPTITTIWERSSNAVPNIYLRISAALFGTLMITCIAIVYMIFVRKDTTYQTTDLMPYLAVGVIMTITLFFLSLVAAFMTEVLT